jgi:hypothetical protein
VRARTTEMATICRYKIIEDQILDYEETDYKYLPLIFVDGNSVMLRQGDGGEARQKTRSYVHHAKDSQRLKNFAGQTYANGLENMIQSKWKMPIEGIPKGAEDAYTNGQMPSLALYHAYDPKNPEKALPPPETIQQLPMPPEVANAFAGADQTIQAVLGSYDASLGINDNQLSGIAIIEGATQSNAAAMPFVVGFLQGLNQAAQVIVDLIPKYTKGAKAVAVVTPDGNRDYAPVNQPGATLLNYSSNSLHVRVEAGVNFSVQKSRALQQIIALSQASPLFGQFINTVGLEVLLDNIEVRGSDQLRELSKQYMKQLQQQQQMQQQMQMQAMQNNPQVMRLQLDQQKLAQESQQDQIDNQLKAAEIASKERQNDIAEAKLVQQQQEMALDGAIKIDQHQTEKLRAAVDAGLQVADQKHRHIKEAGELMHKRDELFHMKQMAERTATQNNTTNA